MRRARLGLSLLLVLATMPLGAFAEGTSPPPGQPLPSTGLVLDQKLTVGGITVSYPTGLEPQARELMAVCQQVIPPRREKCLAAARAFSDQKAIAERVADLLGRPDHADAANNIVSAIASVTEALTDALFLPLIVRDDGTFRTPPGLGLAEWVAQPIDELVVGSAITLRAAAIHQAAEVILDGLGCDHPFTRWFSEGVANWVALQVVAQVAPEYLQLCVPVNRPWNRHGCFPGLCGESCSPII